MSARRLLPLGLFVTLLLGVAGIASHGRPLAGDGRASGPTASFFDYVATTLVIGAVLIAAVVAYFVFSERDVPGGLPHRSRWHMVSTLVALAVSTVLAFFILHSHFEQRLKELEQRMHVAKQQGQPVRPPAAKSARNPRLRWDEIAVVLALIGGVAVVLLAGRRARRPLRPLSSLRRDEVSFALDESIEDLRDDPDLRRAIVAAYARMEDALARSGVARRPSEAPFEYFERALLALETSSDAVRRLTTLFERAKFSHHEPEPAMRNEAIDALLAVREDLRRPAVPV